MHQINAGPGEQQQPVALPGVVAPLHRRPGVRDEPGAGPRRHLPRRRRRHVPRLARAPAHRGLDPAAPHGRSSGRRAHPVPRHSHLSLIREAHFLGVGASFCQGDVNRVSRSLLWGGLSYAIWFVMTIFCSFFFALQNEGDE